MDTIIQTPYRYKPLAFDDDVDSGSRRGRNCWRVINAIMSVFFLLSTYVQLNDPDPYIWVPVYLLAAMLSISVAINPDVKDNVFWKRVTAVHMILCVVGAGILIFLIVDILVSNPSNPLEHEIGRELGGLLLVLAWLALCRFAAIDNAEFTTLHPRMTYTLLLLAGLLGILPLVFWSLCFVDGLHTQLGHCKDMIPRSISSSHIKIMAISDTAQHSV